MSIKTIQQNRFDGGLTENQRDTSGNKLWYTENVILEKNLVSQTINNSDVNSNGYSTAFNIRKMILVGTTVYGLGQNNVTDKYFSLYSKSVSTGGDWGLVTNGTINGYVNNSQTDNFFVSYGGDIYFWAGNYICKYSGTIMTNNLQAFNGVMNGGIVWQGNMYGHSSNKIYKVNTDAVPTEMIIIPSDQTIKQMIGYGNYMAIICSSSTGVSKMYIWDGVTTTTFSEIVEIGVGRVSGGELLDGIIYSVMSLPNSKGFRLLAYSGGRFISVYNYNGRYNRARTNNFTVVSSQVKKASGCIYFIVAGTREDSTFTNGYEAQVFRYGKVNHDSVDSLSCWKTLYTGGNFTLSGSGHEFLIIESKTTQQQTLMATLNGIDAIYTSNYFESTTTYNATENTTSLASAVLEFPIFTGDKPFVTKSLKGITLTYDPLPTTGQVVLKYKINEDTNKAASTWTTIFTDTTDYSISHDAKNIESTGNNFPKFKEIQFRVELSGNAKLTGLRFKYEEEPINNCY